MGFWESRGLRGSTLEDYINMTNENYMKDGLAVIQKLPTSIKPIKLDQKKGVITLAYFDQKSTVDYMGNVQGIPVCFDAKETSKKSLPISNIHKHQIEFMDKFTKQQGMAFIIIYFSEYDEYYLLPFEILKKFWDNASNGGRKSIPYNACDKRLEVKRKNSFLLHYLEAISTYIELKEISEI